MRLRSEERRVGKECRYRWSLDQAEDGIRDIGVTGVQTCALPILVETSCGLLRRETFCHERRVISYRGVYAAPLVPQLVSTTLPVCLRWIPLCGPLGSPMQTHAIKIGRASCRERV